MGYTSAGTDGRETSKIRPDGMRSRGAAAMTEPAKPPVIGVIGGSGVYDIEGLSDAAWRKVDTPFGDASDELLHGTLDGQPLVFLPRHGRGHAVPPSALNFRANIYALKAAGVTEIVSVSAVGSLKQALPPGTFVLVDQFIDRTFARIKSFFGPGFAAHVSMADPVCARLRGHLKSAAEAIGVPFQDGGTYLVMEGPQFSTRAESELYRTWGCDVIGMTNMPEAKLAREAEVCYATVAMATDYDCWHDGHDDVSVEQVVKVLMENADKARALVRDLVPRLAARTLPCDAGCQHALDNAIITQAARRDPVLSAQLSLITARALGA